MLPDTYLSIQKGRNGSFVSWLKDLGLEDLINRYSLPKLLEWGWLVPQYRVAFPLEYFDLDFEGSNDPSFEVRNRLLGWGRSWRIENDEDQYWFLHPFCRPNGAYDTLLNDKDYSATTNADYFYHWQAYALIDVVREADTLNLLNTPDLVQEIERIAKVINKNQTKPSDVLSRPQQWGGFAKPMSWLSHYRAFRDALPVETDRPLHKRGAEALATYLGIDAEILEKSIKEQLLEGLLGNWLRANDNYCEWTLRAWPYLQRDMFYAMEWLCCLNGKAISEYFNEWQFSCSREVWPPLHKVLPFEFYEDRQYFSCVISLYNKHYKDIRPTNAEFGLLASHFQQVNYPFDSMLYAFRQLHEHLRCESKQQGELDFRVLRPLDYYSLLSIRAEACLRLALANNYSLSNIPSKEQNLERYIIELAQQVNILPSSAIECFKNEAGRYTKLYDTQDKLNPIREIMNIRFNNRSKKETQLIQAFLCCVLARNYFAHHTYLDKEFMRNQREELAFMLIGILLTVLKLLGDPV